MVKITDSALNASLFSGFFPAAIIFPLHKAPERADKKRPGFASQARQPAKVRRPRHRSQPPMSRRNRLSPTHRLGEGPAFANSSRFHSASFQRQPVSDSTGPRLHSTPLHRLKSSNLGNPRTMSTKISPAHRPKDQSDLCRSGQAAGLTPARHPQAKAPRVSLRSSDSPSKVHQAHQGQFTQIPSAQIISSPLKQKSLLI